MASNSPFNTGNYYGPNIGSRGVNRGQGNQTGQNYPRPYQPRQQSIQSQQSQQRAADLQEEAASDEDIRRALNVVAAKKNGTFNVSRDRYNAAAARDGKQMDKDGNIVQYDEETQRALNVAKAKKAGVFDVAREKYNRAAAREGKKMDEAGNIVGLDSAPTQTLYTKGANGRYKASRQVPIEEPVPLTQEELDKQRKEALLDKYAKGQSLNDDLREEAGLPDTPRQSSADIAAAKARKEQADLISAQESEQAAAREAALTTSKEKRAAEVNTHKAYANSLKTKLMLATRELQPLEAAEKAAQSNLALPKPDKAAIAAARARRDAILKQVDEADTKVLDSTLAYQKHLDEAATEGAKIDVFKAGIKARHARTVSGITVNTNDAPTGTSYDSTTGRLVVGKPSTAAKPDPQRANIFRNTVEDENSPQNVDKNNIEDLASINDPASIGQSKLMQQRMQMAQAEEDPNVAHYAQKDVEARTANPTKWEEAQYATMEALSDEDLAGKLQLMPQVIEQGMQVLEQTKAEAQAEQEGYQQKLDAIMAGAAKQDGKPFSMADSVVDPVTGGRWHRATLALRDSTMEAAKTALAKQQAALDTDAAELERDQRVHEKRIEEYNRRQAVAKEAQSKQREAGFRELELSGNEDLVKDLRSLDKEGRSRVEGINPIIKPGSDEHKAAVDEIAKDVSSKTKAAYDKQTAQAEAGRKLYDAFGHKYQVDWSDPEASDGVTSMMLVEAEKYGLTEKQARRWLSTYAQADWSKPSAVGKGSSPLVHTAGEDASQEYRVLPNGNITVNPGNLLDKAEYERIVKSAPVSKTAKEHALKVRQEIAPELAAKSIKTLRTNDKMAEWLDDNTSGTDLERMEQFTAKMKAGGWTTAAMYRFASSLASLGTSWTGAAAAATGSDTFTQASVPSLLSSSWWKNRAEQFSTAAGTAEKGTGTLGKYAAMAVGGIPSVAESMVAGNVAGGVYKAVRGVSAGAKALQAAGVTGAALDAAIQQGGSTYVDAYDKYLKDEIGNLAFDLDGQDIPKAEIAAAKDRARMKALKPALLDALQTAGLTALGGAKGTQAIFRAGSKEALQGAVKKTMVKKLGELGIDIGEETLEEYSNQFVSGVIAQATYEPDKTIKQIFEQAFDAGIVGGVLGGAGGAFKQYSDRNNSDEGQHTEAVAQPAGIKPEDLAAINKAIKNYTGGATATPEESTRTRNLATAVVKLRGGASLAGLTQAELTAVGYERKADKIVPIKDAQQMAYEQDGKVVITDPAIQEINDAIPATNILGLKTEAERLDEINNPPEMTEQDKQQAEGTLPSPTAEQLAKPEVEVGPAGKPAPKTGSEEWLQAMPDSELDTKIASAENVVNKAATMATQDGGDEGFRNIAELAQNNLDRLRGEKARRQAAPQASSDPNAQLKTNGGDVVHVADHAAAEKLAGRPVQKGRRAFTQRINGKPTVVVIDSEVESQKQRGGEAEMMAEETAHAQTMLDEDANPALADEADAAMADDHPDFDPALDAFMRANYNGYHKLSNRQKRYEAVAKIVNGEYKGKAQGKGIIALLKDMLAKLLKRDPKGSNAAIQKIASNVRSALGIASVDASAHEAATSPLNDKPQPTEAQQAAGNYKLGKFKLAGMTLTVEHPQGSTRGWTDQTGRKGQTVMQDHYGRILGTVGMDGDHVDAFINPGTPEDFAGDVYVIDQSDPKTGKLDEHKIMVGYPSLPAAREAYLRNYEVGWKGLKKIQAMPISQLADLVKSGKLRKSPSIKSNERPNQQPSAVSAKPSPATNPSDSNAGKLPSNGKTTANDGAGVDEAEMRHRGQSVSPSSALPPIEAQLNAYIGTLKSTKAKAEAIYLRNKLVEFWSPYLKGGIWSRVDVMPTKPGSKEADRAGIGAGVSIHDRTVLILHPQMLLHYALQAAQNEGLAKAEQMLEEAPLHESTHTLDPNTEEDSAKLWNLVSEKTQLEFAESYNQGLPDSERAAASRLWVDDPRMHAYAGREYFRAQLGKAIRGKISEEVVANKNLAKALYEMIMRLARTIDDFATTLKDKKLAGQMRDYIRSSAARFLAALPPEVQADLRRKADAEGRTLPGVQSQPADGDNGRSYTIYLDQGNGKKHYIPKLEPMTHGEALAFRSKQTNPAQWGLEELPPTKPTEKTPASPKAPSRPAIGKAPPQQRIAIAKGMSGGPAYAEFASATDADAYRWYSNMRAAMNPGKNASPQAKDAIASTLLFKVARATGLDPADLRYILIAYNKAVREQAKGVAEGEAFHAPTLREFIGGGEQQMAAPGLSTNTQKRLKQIEARVRQIRYDSKLHGEDASQNAELMALNSERRSLNSTSKQTTPVATASEATSNEGGGINGPRPAGGSIQAVDAPTLTNNGEKSSQNMAAPAAMEARKQIQSDFDEAKREAEEDGSNFDEQRFIYSLRDGDLEEAFPDIYSDYFGNPETTNQIVYHHTPDENADSIIENGVGAMSKTRGLNNRGVRAAVFTSAEPDPMNSYGDTVVAIDLGAARKLSGVSTSLEPAIAESIRREAVANMLGIDDANFEPDSGSGETPDTLIIHGSVPKQAIQVSNKDGEVLFTGSAFGKDQAMAAPSYRSPTSMLAATKAQMQGRAGAKPAGLASMFNPQAKRPATVPDIHAAYASAASGKSSAYITLDELYDALKAKETAITPKQMADMLRKMDENGEASLEISEDTGTTLRNREKYGLMMGTVPASGVAIHPRDTHIMPDGYRLTEQGVQMMPKPAHHGTPHKVDRFRTTRIGTGEGAQAYGHGLYFAGNKAVAEQYRKDLSGYDELTIYTKDGKKKGNELDAIDIEAAKYLEIGEKTAGQFKHNTVYYAKQKAEAAGKLDVVSRIDSYGRDAKIGYEKNTGNLYTVEILPEEDELLDWDENVAPAMAKKLAKMALFKPFNKPGYMQSTVTAEDISKMTGKELYELIGHRLQAKTGYGQKAEVSFFLLDRGIPGIRYLDGNSRSAGEGTHNYVIFDDNLVRILEENGKPVGEATPREVQQMGAPATATVKLGGKEIKTGDPVTFNYLHNKSSYTKLLKRNGQAYKPSKEDGFDRGYEPSGQYMVESDGTLAKSFPNDYKTGERTFENPIVLDEGTYGEPNSWKRVLSNAFGGKTGKRLSQAIITAGHDGIVTANNGRSGEIVDLTTFDPKQAMYMSAPMPQREAFYSKLAQVIEAKMPVRADAKAVRGMIGNQSSGVKAEEIKWSGINNWLDGQSGLIEKADVLAYLNGEGAVRFVEHRKGEQAFDATFAEEGDDGMWHVYGERANEGDVYDTAAEANAKVEEYNSDIPEGPSKYSQYQLPGGENYREVVLAMPETGRAAKEKLHDEVDAEYRLHGNSARYDELQRQLRIATNGLGVANYKSSHFTDVPNYVAHMRLNDRSDSEGQPGTFIEEIQSDRHQHGREKGYKEDYESRFSVEYRPGENYGGDWSVVEKTKGVIESRATEDEAKKAAAVWEKGLLPADKFTIPDAPYRTSWPLQMFKRALAEAVSTGKKWVGWTMGQAHTDRWGTERIEWKGQDDGSFLIDAKSQHGGIAGDVDLEGEANARNMNAKNAATVRNKAELIEAIKPSLTEGQDPEKLGEKLWTRMQTERAGISFPRKEGFEGFYDTILPAAVNDYIKQWKNEDGIKPKVKQGMVQSVVKSATPSSMDALLDELDDDGNIKPESYPPLKQMPIWRVDITPAMAAGVEAGQALFMAAPSQQAQANIDSATYDFARPAPPTDPAHIRNAKYIPKRGLQSNPQLPLVSAFYSTNSERAKAGKIIRSFENDWAPFFDFINDQLPAEKRKAGLRKIVDKFAMGDKPEARALWKAYAAMPANEVLPADSERVKEAKELLPYLENLTTQMMAAPRLSTNMEEMELGDFNGDEENDGYLYHVTTKDRIDDIVYEGNGLIPNAGGQFQGAAAQANSKGRIFLTEKSGVPVWAHEIEQQLLHSRDYDEDQEPSDDLTVVRVPRSLVTGLQDDFAEHPAVKGRDYFTTSPIPASPQEQMMGAPKSQVTPEQDAELFASLKNPTRSLAIDIQFLADLAESKPFQSKGFDGLSVSDRRSVLNHVFSLARAEPQVFKSIVSTIPVDVVNDLFSGKLPSDMSLHDEAMFKDGLPATLHKSIPTSIKSSNSLRLLIEQVALMRAEMLLGSNGLTRTLLADASALNAGDSNSGQRTLPSLAQKSPASSGDRITVSATKPTLTSNGVRGKDEKLSFADFTGLLGFHDGILTPVELRDKIYLAAVESGDVARQQAMVDAAAKAAGFAEGPLLHGTKKHFTVFERPKNSKSQEMFSFGHHFTDSPELASQYGDKKVSAFLKYNSGLDAEVVVDKNSRLGQWLKSINPKVRWFPDQGREVVYLRNALDELPPKKLEAELRKAGYDALRYRAKFQERGVGHMKDIAEGDTVVVFDPNQIKSADPITRNQDGSIIPLSERFNDQSNDIRYMGAPKDQGDLDSRVLNRLANQMPEDEYLDQLDTAHSESFPEGSEGDWLRALQKENTTPDTVKAWDKAARKMIAADPQAVIDEIVNNFYEGKSFGSPELALAGSILSADVLKQAQLSGDEAQLRKARAFSYAVGAGETQAGRELRALNNPHKSNRERVAEVIANLFTTPPPAIRARIAAAPSPSAKLKKIAELQKRVKELERQIVAGDKAAQKKAAAAQKELDAALQEKDKAQLVDEALAKREKKVKAALANEGLAVEDILLTPEDRLAAQDSEIVERARAKHSKAEQKALLWIGRGFSDTDVAKFSGMERGAVATLRENYRNNSLKPEIAKELKKGRSIIEVIKDSFKKAFGIQMAAPLPWGNVQRVQPTPPKPPANKAAQPPKVEDTLAAEIDRMLDILAPNARAANGNSLLAAVVKGKNGTRVTIQVPFDADDFKSVYRVARAISISESSGFDKVYEYWINNLLSGPQTNVVNIIGNTLSVGLNYAFQRPAETIINIAARDADSAQLGEWKYIAKGMTTGLGEAWQNAILAYTVEADPTAHRYLDEPVQIGFTPTGDVAKMGGYRGPSIKGLKGRIVRIPGRLLRMMDAMFKTFILHAEVGAMAYRFGKIEQAAGRIGPTGADLQAYIQSQIDTKGSKSWMRAMRTATELTFQDENWLTDIAKHITQGADKSVNKRRDEAAKAYAEGDTELAHSMELRANIMYATAKLMSIIFPFVRTPSNILRMGVRKSPIGSLLLPLHFIQMIRQGITNKRDGKDFLDSYPKGVLVKLLAEQTLAWLVAAKLFTAIEGDDDDDKKGFLIVGGRPWKDAGAKDAAYRDYGGTYMLIFRDAQGKETRIPFGRYEPVATLLGTTADAIRRIKERATREKLGEPGADAEDAIKALMGDFVNQAQDKSFLKGIGGVMKEIDSLENSGDLSKGLKETAWKSVLTAVVPNIIRQVMRNMDDKVRDSKKKNDYYDAFPMGSNAEPAIDLMGNDADKGGNALSRIFFPVANAQKDTHPITPLIHKWNSTHPGEKVEPTPLNRSGFYIYNTDGKTKIPLVTPQEKSALQRVIGANLDASARNIVDNITANGGELPENFDDVMQKTVAKARSDARKTMLQSSPFLAAKQKQP